MPERSTSRDLPHLFVTFDKHGGIDTISLFHATATNVMQAINARAVVVGASKYQALRITQGKEGDLEFQRL